jgi:hypothetical protein
LHSIEHLQQWTFGHELPGMFRSLAHALFSLY